MSIVAPMFDSLFDQAPEDQSITKYELQEYLTDNTTLSDNDTLYTIQHKHVDSFVNPHRSYLLIQGQLNVAAGGAAYGAGDDIALVNNAGLNTFQTANSFLDGTILNVCRM